MPGNSIDILGIIMKVGQLSSINTRDGLQKEKREITVCDDSEYAISVTLWGEMANMEIQEDILFAMKNTRVGEWNGRSLNGSNSINDFYMNRIDHPNAEKVMKWYRQMSPEDLQLRLKNLSS